MTVNVDTDLLRTDGSEVLDCLTECEELYQKVIGTQCGNCESFESFKSALSNKFTEFSNHSTIISNKLYDCSNNLEEIDRIIGSSVTSSLASADSYEFIETNSVLSAVGSDDTSVSINDDTVVSSNIQPKNNSDISHRGYRTGGIKDNTVQAFINAGESGFWGCETDVRFDNDGNLVCSHNALKDGQTAPTFEEYLDVCKEYGMTAIIDLKYARGIGPADPDLSPQVIKTIQEKGMMDSCILQTNNLTDIPYIRETASDARIWMLTPGLNDKNKSLIDEYNIECVNLKAPDWSRSESVQSFRYNLKYLNDKGIDACVWNVFKEGSKDYCLNAGAKYVMSDNVLGITPYQEGDVDFNNIEN